MNGGRFPRLAPSCGGGWQLEPEERLASSLHPLGNFPLPWLELRRNPCSEGSALPSSAKPSEASSFALHALFFSDRIHSCESGGSRESSARRRLPMCRCQPISKTTSASFRISLRGLMDLLLRSSSFSAVTREISSIVACTPAGISAEFSLRPPEGHLEAVTTEAFLGGEATGWTDTAFAASYDCAMTRSWSSSLNCRSAEGASTIV
mmetsp:Transcript_11555/g.28558  ORF Transcript_11555/g.28558 Transcript_11555/m.28558 type:complete len:207 (+) Transcript_11555:667-1287(+)